MTTEQGDELEDGEQTRLKPSSRWLAIALCVFPGGGSGHFYLGRTRRAVVWAVLPLTLYASYLLLLIRTPLPSLYWSYVLVFPFMTLAIRGAMALDVLLLRASSLRRAPWLYTALFGTATLALWVAGQFMVRAHLVEPFRIASEGMGPSLLNQEHVIVDKAAFRERVPRRGEVAVLSMPDDPRIDYIGRVVAVPGDRLEVVSGRPVINGWEVPRCALGTAALPEHPELTGHLELEFLGDAAYLVFLEDGRGQPHEGPYQVASGEVWVLGDHRNNSVDSRAWRDGQGAGAPLENLRGRPVFAWLSFDPKGYPDWSRLGANLNEPRLPTHLHHLNRALQDCLARRPARTTPP
jgi:signal peptidase I